MRIRCLIVDDEPLAQRVIEKYAGEVPYLEVVCKCSNALEAIELLDRQEVDLVFLDINMPKISGIDFLRTRKTMPHVIITTAYAEFAIQGYELDVVDYLMKPFGFDRFLRAVEKAKDLIYGGRVPKSPEKPQEEPYVFIKSSKKTYRVNLDSILFIEALGDYVKIHTTERMIVSYQSLKNIAALLPPNQFPRVHKSFIVSLPRVEMIENNHIRIRDRLIPIGTNYKQDFDKLILSI